jgi:hypothetical protein
MMKKSLSHVLFAAMLSLALLPASAAEKENKPAIDKEAKKTVKATVEAIDTATRTLTLKGPKGLVSLQVPEDVVRFPQIKVGDIVQADYFESLVVDIKKAGDLTPARSVQVAAVPIEGQKPAGIVGAQVTSNVTIKAIDRETKSLTVENVDGDELSFRVKKAKLLKSLAVGDLVAVTYTTAVAIEVKPHQ